MKKSYSFNYRVIDTKSNSMIADNLVNVEFSDDEFNKIANAMRKNGGYAVEMEDLDPSISNYIWETAMQDFSDQHENDDSIDFDNIELDVISDIPEEAFAEAEKLVGNKSIDIDYYYIQDGKEKKESMQCYVANDIFYKMVELAQEDHEGISDMDYLKSKNPAMYNIIFYDADVWANNLHLAQEGKQVKIELREFPFQVYEAVYPHTLY